MNRLQIRLFGPYFSSFLLYSYGYGAANELKSVLKHPNFRFGPYSPTGSEEIKDLSGGVVLYAAQSNPPIDAEIAEKGRFRTKTSYWIK
ncbi:MAG: hypothetical protein IH613_12140 [Desulfuromonadales bacterium]|nr:hypothetical protein [Desulfuromonadales bacterium]